ncbi:MAG TPA: hypothetical protein VF797_04130 [Noviherbaspirillum sp.]
MFRGWQSGSSRTAASRISPAPRKAPDLSFAFTFRESNEFPDLG